MSTFNETPTPELEVNMTSCGPINCAELIASRYRILESIGAGGMGHVYRAEDAILDRVVAVKLLTGRMEPSRAIRFQREAIATSQLKHPGIVEVYDFGVTEDGLPYMVMEYVEGETLKALLAEVRLSMRDTISVMVQICEAMGHAHERKIVHRDLKPANIIATTLGASIEVRVLDFGISKMVAGNFDAQQLTNTGHIVGSPSYLSPEQAQGADVDGRADIYAVGCILFECLIGRPPFEGDRAIDIVQQHMQSPSPSICEVEPASDFPRELDTIIAKALSKKPEQRFNSMSELRDALLSVPLPELARTKFRDSLELQEETATRVTERWTPLFFISLFACILLACVFVIKRIPQDDQTASITPFKAAPLPFSSKEVGFDVDRGSVTVKVSADQGKERIKEKFHIIQEKDGQLTAKFNRGKVNFESLSPSELTAFRKVKRTVDRVCVECRHVTREQIKEFCSLPIKLLRLEHCDVGDAELAPLRSAKRIDNLDLRGARITAKTLDALKDLKNLKTLRLQDCTRVDGESLRKIVQFAPKLQSLDIGCTALMNADVHMLCELKHLNTLDIANIDHLTDAHIRDLRSMPSLNKLTLTNNALLTDRTCAILETFPHLKKVSLQKCLGISSEAIERLRRRPGLEVQSDGTGGLDDTLVKIMSGI